ncbi:MAG: serine protease [Acidobacteriota bacterium]|nr:serine protease [Acidobacteriota bacterium]
MPKQICSFALLAIVLFLVTPNCAAQDMAGRVEKQQERSILSLDLEFSRKNQDLLERAVSLLVGTDPNGYATGFLVRDGLVITAYHVVSGDLSPAKKRNLGFKAGDKLNVKVYIKGCRATILKVDKDADLALLEICATQKQTNAPTFQTALSKDEQLLLIARPHGNKMVSRGVFHGPYNFGGQEYWSAKIVGRDGYSGSPVYNHKGEVIGIFTGYDTVQKVALISPAFKAQRLLDDYSASPKP